MALRSFWDEPRAAEPPEPGWRDGVLVGLVMMAALVEGVLGADVAWRPVVTVVAMLLALVLLWRRTHPLACIVVGFGTGLALELAGLLGGVPGVGLDAMVFLLVLVFALIRWGAGREIVMGLAVVLVVAVFSMVVNASGPAEVVGAVGVLMAAAAGGAALRYRAESERRAHDQIRSQERVRLARELHDTVAHHLSAITVQAQAGQVIGGMRPEAAVEALVVIEAEAARTLAEMRTMVRVLRDGAPVEYAPPLGVAALVDLARPGTAPIVEVELTGELDGLPPQVDAAIYRIAQEALTNALRHARRVSRVEIRVVGGTGSLHLRVTDDGQIDPERRPAPHGFGLLGMAERVQLLGGTMRAGPMSQGGWAVVAELPTGVPR